MANRIYAGVIGLLIKIDMDETISAATGYSLNVKKPNGLLVVWTPTIGTDTEFYYVTVVGDLADAGSYIIQPRFTLGAWNGLGTPVKLRVSRPYL